MSRTLPRKIVQAGVRAGVLAGLLVAAAPQLSYAQSSYAQLGAPPPIVAPPIVAPHIVAPLDQELWAGVSYREALVGLAILAGGAVVVTWLTGSTVAGLTAAGSVGAAYVVYDDPSLPSILTPNDLPSLSDLSVNGTPPKD
jgi:hypothetical protein